MLVLLSAYNIMNNTRTALSIQDSAAPRVAVAAVGAGCVLCGGQQEAKRLLALFLQNGLKGFAKARYAHTRNGPSCIARFMAIDSMTDALFRVSGPKSTLKRTVWCLFQLLAALSCT
jgi:hypothetical protein